MDQELLRTLGIDPTLPLEELLEQLQDKNLEFLERLDNCSDPVRAEELRKTQKKIEDAIMTCSTGVSLERKIKKHQERSSQAADDPSAGTAQGNDRLNAAIADYQAGDLDRALPVLEEYARQNHILACLLTADILKQNNRTVDAMVYLGVAAEQGDGTAAFMLAKLCLEQHNYVSAQRWGRLAMEQKIDRSGTLLFAASREEDIKPILEELSWMSPADRYARLMQLCDYLKERTKTYGELNAKDDLMLQDVYTALHTDERSHRQLRQYVPRYAELCDFWDKGGSAETFVKQEAGLERYTRSIWLISSAIAAAMLWVFPLVGQGLSVLLTYPLFHLLTLPVLNLVKTGYCSLNRIKLSTNGLSGGEILLWYVGIWAVTFVGIYALAILLSWMESTGPAFTARVIFTIGTAWTYHSRLAGARLLR